MGTNQGSASALQTAGTFSPGKREHHSPDTNAVPLHPRRQTTTAGAENPCPNAGWTGQHLRTGEVRPCPYWSALWFGKSGTLTDPGANIGEPPAPQINRRKLGRSPENQRSKATLGASP